LLISKNDVRPLLKQACKYGKLECLKYVLESSASIQKIDLGRLLGWAITHDELEIVKYLC